MTLRFQRNLLNLAGLLAGLLFTTQPVLAQQPDWIDLKERGANYYDVKKAFLKKNAEKISEFKRELRKESKKGKTRDADASEKNMEEILQFMRWSQFVEPRVQPSGGDLAAMQAAHLKASEQRVQKLKERTPTSANTGNWTAVGPKTTPAGGGNGRLNAVRVHPANSNILFACSPVGGLWKSVNSGGSWTAVTDQLSTLGCTDVAFDPINPNTMYLATGDRDHYDAPSTGVYKSADGGATWAATGLTFSSSSVQMLAAILVNPNNPSVLIAAGSSGIYRSANGGVNWTQTNTANIKDVHFKADDPNILFASGKSYFRSADGGATWQDLTASSGLPANARRLSIGVTPADGNYVYVLACNNSDYGFQGLYRSTDAGATFTLASSTPNILGYNFDGGDKGGQGWYTLSVAVSPTDKKTVYTGGVNIWKSSDGGSTWTIQTHWYGDKGLPYVHADVHDLKISGSNIFASCDGGVFKASLGGGGWSDLSSNLSIAQIYGIGLSATNPNLIISGHQDNGTNLTKDKAAWSEVIGGDGMQCFIDRTTDAVQYGELYYGDFQKTNDGGNNFVKIGTGFKNGAWVTPWLQDPSVSNTLYAGGYDVYKSVNGGSSFSTISAFGQTASMVALDVAPTNNQYIYAAFSNKVYKTVNGGGSWTDITGGLPSGISITSLRVDPNNPNTLCVSFATYGSQQVYMSQNGGAWTNFSAGLPAVPVESVAFDKTSNSQAMYAGTDLGVYYRDATSNSWAYFSTGIPGVPIYDLKIFYGSPKKIRAATFGRGIYEGDLYASPNLATPQVAVTAPAENAIFTAPATVTIAASASETGGSIVKVEFYNGSFLLGTIASAPYTYNWTSVAAGAYTITAKAYDAASQAAVSAPVHITVNNPVILTPQAAITSPAEGAVFVSPASVPIAASASEPGGSIAKVEFYNGASLLGTVNAAPYLFAWTNVPAGAYTLTAKAYDAALKSVVSSPVHITVNNPVFLDAGISSVVSPVGTVSSFYLSPVVILKNYGTVTLTSANINYKVDNAAETSAPWFGTLAPGASANVTLYGIFFTNGAHTFTVRSSAPNNGTDANPGNDASVSNFAYGTVPVTADAGITVIAAPSGTVNNASTTPVVTLQNFDATPLTSVFIYYKLDGGAESVYSWSGNLAAGSATNLSLPSVSYAYGAHTFSSRTSLPNGVADANTANDGAAANFTYPVPVVNDAGITAVTVPAGNIQTSTISPVVTLKNYGNTTLQTVVIKGTLDGATASSSSLNWTGSLAPGASASVTLAPISYAAGSHSFTAATSLPNGAADANAQNDAASSNFTYTPPQPDAGISAILTPGSVVFLFTFTPVVVLKNYGVLNITSADIYYKIDNGSETVYHWTGSLAPGATTSVTLTGGFIFFGNGRHSFSAWTSLPNGVADGVPANDALSVNFTYNSFGFDPKPIAENSNTYERLDFSVFPNPAREIAYLQIKAPVTGLYTLTMSNILGGEIQKQTLQLSAGDNLAPVSLRDTPGGIYFIRLENESQKAARKLTVR